MMTKASHFSKQYEENMCFPEKLRSQFRVLVTVTTFQVDWHFTI